MKKILKLFVFIIALMVVAPIVRAEDKKVKVYMFEAGGCPYCEAQEEYLKGLDSYDKKFELIKKELYVDHVDWEEGKDYELGVKVATAFYEVGFENATYQGTPFVVISDIYATASYSESLEEVINEAYELGDKDIVGCYEDGNDDCLDHLKVADNTKKSININYNILVPVLVTILCSVGIIILYILKSNKDKKQLISLLKNETETIKTDKSNKEADKSKKKAKKTNKKEKKANK